MVANYVLLERIELNANATSITFNNIPQSGYTDLKLVYSLRGSTNVSYKYEHPRISINGGTTGNYASKMLYANGTSILAADDSSYGSTGYASWDGLFNSADTASNSFSNNELYFPNYTNSQTKAMYARGTTGNNVAGGANWGISDTASAWNQTAAITSITLTASTGQFVQYSSASLYGIAATNTTPVIAPKANGGNIYNDGTYWYHTFLSTSVFTPLQSLNADILVVAGGGGGGGTVGGGGGAGGLLGFTAQSLTTTSYTCQVGAGGTGSTTNTNFGGNGSLSQFGALTVAVGGGGGVGLDGGTGSTGGSGGGGNGLGGTEGSGTSGQGNSGGAGAGQLGGGGGGANAVGGGYAAYGAGGIGSSAYSTWGAATGQGENVSGTYYFAGGGGGGTNNAAGGNANTTLNVGGNGGGGRGGTSTGPTLATGTINTGGGGGGGRGNGAYAGASGGSGIIIIRYAMA